MKIAVSLAALTFAVLASTPSSADMTCTPANMAITNTMMTSMADGHNKTMMMHEFNTAHIAMNKGDLRGCNKSMTRIEACAKNMRSMSPTAGHPTCV